MEGRPLTSGEERLARYVFGTSINYRNLRLVETGDREYTRVVFGTIYFPPDDYLSDFVESNMRWPPDFELATLFIHEMTHVWQHYVGLSGLITGRARADARKRLRANGVKLWRMRFKDRLNAIDNEVYDNYAIDPDDFDLLDFNTEEQADIVADYFTSELGYGALRGPQTDYERVLRDFLADPAYPRDPRRRFGRIRNLRATVRSWER